MTGSLSTTFETEDAKRERLVGVACALGAFVFWGLSPLYFHAVAHVGPWEVVAHRIVWTVVLMLGLLTLSGRLGHIAPVLRNRRYVLVLLCTTVIICLNWTAFIWGVQQGRLYEISLGYFINPLVNVALGLVFLGERLRRWQTVAVSLAAIGVAYQLIALGTIPWVGLWLAVSFGVYGMIRKTVRIEPLVGLLVETLLMLPLALGFLIWLAVLGLGDFGPVSMGGDGWGISLLLMCSGIATGVPLVLFVAGAQRLPFTSIGLLQYLAPTIQFALATLVLRESFDPQIFVTFGFIWVALVIFSTDAVRTYRLSNQIAHPPA
ncbi:MAG: EamA family transporter RarD [Pseudomonadota bacterium]